MRFTLILISLIIILPIALLGQKKIINPVDTVTYKCGTLSNIEYDGVYFKAAKANIYYNAISKILFSGRRINGYSGYARLIDRALHASHYFLAILGYKNAFY
ncbi:MAG: hypothetical protein IPO33_12355 [Saprospiraceae bacterium]|nr:hypothetical protein [Candidatus Brachybacter algidus]